MNRRLFVQLLIVVSLLAALLTACAPGSLSPAPTVEPQSTTAPQPAVVPNATPLPQVEPTVEPIGVSASPRDPSVTGVARWGTLPVPDAIVELRTGDWHVNANATLQRAMTDPEGRYTLLNPPAGDYVMCGLFPEGVQEHSTCTPVHIEAGQDVADLNVMLVRELPMLEPAVNAQVATVPTLAWKSYLGAAKYEVFIIDAGTTELAVHETVAETLFSSPAPLKVGRTYTWVVNALANDGGLLADATSDMTVTP